MHPSLVSGIDQVYSLFASPFIVGKQRNILLGYQNLQLLHHFSGQKQQQKRKEGSKKLIVQVSVAPPFVFFVELLDSTPDDSYH
jgi:hypothetical protein